MLPTEPDTSSRSAVSEPDHADGGRHRHRRSDTTPVPSPPYRPYPDVGRARHALPEPPLPPALPGGVPRPRAAQWPPRHDGEPGSPMMTAEGTGSATEVPTAGSAAAEPPVTLQPMTSATGGARSTDTGGRRDTRPRAGWDSPASPARARWRPGRRPSDRDPCTEPIPALDSEMAGSGAPGSAAPGPGAPGPGPGHGHGHGPAPAAGRRVRLLIAALLVPCALATALGVILLWPGGPRPTSTLPAQQPVQAQVGQATAAECSPGDGAVGRCVAARGPDDGRSGGRAGHRPDRPGGAGHTALRGRRPGGARLVGR